MDGRDGELTSALARDTLLDQLEALGRALVAFQQAYLAVLAAVRAHDGGVPTEADTPRRAVSGSARG